jgi:hypothetical protein
LFVLLCDSFLEMYSKKDRSLSLALTSGSLEISTW